MDIETVNQLTSWLSLITLLMALAGSIFIVGAAAYQSLTSRRVRWDMLLFVLVILWALPYGIRNYGPALTDATIDLMFSLAEKRPEMEAAIRAFVGTGDVVPTRIVQPTPQWETPEPIPTFELTVVPIMPTSPPAATATPEPTAVPLPTIAPTATLFLCRDVSQITSGCILPTPVPGGK